MKKILIILLFVSIFLNGCSKKEKNAFPGEDNIQPYMQKVLDMAEVPDFDYSPSIEDLFITAFKAALFDDNIKYMKSAMSKDGVLVDSKCVIYLSIGEFYTFCEGKTRLYIDGKLIREFDSEEKNGNSYLLLSEDLNQRITKSVLTPTWYSDSIRGKKIYAHFYMKEEDWARAVADKDPYKYLCLDIYIRDDK